MIPIFDLDDTLYPEASFVESGFRAVAVSLNIEYGWSVEESMKYMLQILRAEGRGLIFDKLLAMHGISNKKIIKSCVDTYRHHKPNISISSQVETILSNLDTTPYLVTDGHKIAQSNKVEALNLERWFQKIYITHRYGIKNAKPSLHCFELIKKREKCQWSSMYYVADNPTKDFVNLNNVGVVTIRVKTGEHREKVAMLGYEAKHIIEDITKLPELIERFNK